MSENWISVLDTYNSFFKEILDGGALSAIYESMKYLGIAIIFAMALKTALEVVSSGGTRPLEPYKDIVLPLIYLGVLFFWLDILSLIETLILYIRESINNGVTLGNVTGREKFNEIMDALMAKSNAKSLAEKIITLDTTSVFPIRIWIYQMLQSLGLFIDQIALTFFYGFSQTILVLLKLTGIIAVVLSFTGKINSFITWIKNFISVHLWLVMAYMVFFIVDQLYVIFIREENLILSGVPDSVLNSLIGHQLFVFIGFGILKLVLMFKVPHIVSMFIGSSSGGSGMFGVMFAPVKIGMDGAKAAASGGKSLVSKFKK